MSIAISFVASLYRKSHLTLQVTLLSIDEIQSLAQQLGIPKFRGNLNDLIDKFHKTHREVNRYYRTFATLGSLQWVQQTIFEGAEIHGPAVFGAASTGHLKIVKFILNIDEESQYFLINAITAATKFGHTNILMYAAESGGLFAHQDELVIKHGIFNLAVKSGNLKALKILVDTLEPDYSYLIQPRNEAKKCGHVEMEQSLDTYIKEYCPRIYMRSWLNYKSDEKNPFEDSDDEM